ncbi:hypothetical protein PanWU01x14_344890, partial [Parasponia andersonii]
TPSLSKSLVASVNKPEASNKPNESSKDIIEIPAKVLPSSQTKTRTMVEAELEVRRKENQTNINLESKKRKVELAEGFMKDRLKSLKKRVGDNLLLKYKKAIE